MNMVPRAKKEKFSGRTIPFSRILTFKADNYSDKIEKLIKYLIPGSVSGYSKEGIIDISFSEELKKEEYILNVKDGKIEIKYFDYSGIRNGLASLSNIVSGEFEIPECEIYDYPLCDYRGILIDMGRGVEDIKRFKEDLILCAKAKLNVLHYHFYDALGSGIKLESFPESMCFDNAYSLEEVKELIEFCDVLGLEIIPEFDIPAHAFSLLRAFPQLKCDTDNENQTDWVACAGTEELYEIYDRVIAEIAKIFPGKFFHVGGDEIEFADKPELGRLCHWNECKKCRAYMEKNNIKDRQDLWYNVLSRVYDMIKKHNKTMVMWSDQLDCNRPIPVPKDVVMQFWRVAGEGRGPFENCSMNAQLRAGFKVINSYFPETYVDMEQYMNPEKLKNWYWDKSPESDEDVKENIIGTEMCAWEYGNHTRYSHYAYSLPSAIILMGDKFWNKDSLNLSEEYEKLVTRTVIGIDTPAGLNVYKCIGDILPPRSDDKIYKDKITCSKEEIYKTVETLKKIKSTYALSYANCITEGMALEGETEKVESLDI